jgi:predicted transposase YdaD
MYCAYALQDVTEYLQNAKEEEKEGEKGEEEGEEEGEDEKKFVASDSHRSST